MEKIVFPIFKYKILAVLFTLMLPVAGMAQSFTNSTEGIYNGFPTVLSSNYTATCDQGFTIEYSFTFSGGGSAVLQWSTDQSTWTDVISSPSQITIAPVTILYFQVEVSDLPDAESVDLVLTVYENLALSSNQVNITTCNGDNNGSITVTADCGINTDYAYSWDYTAGSYSSEFVDPGNVNFAVDLYAGTYTITVTTDASGEEESIEVVLTEPDPVLISVTGEDYYCSAAEVAVIINFSGGTEPYVLWDVLEVFRDINVGTGPEYTFTTSIQGEFNFYITANGCSSDTVLFEVKVDQVDPDCATLPDNFYYMPIAQYQSLAAVNTALPVDSLSTETSATSDTTIYLINTNNFDDLTLSIDVSQNGSGWENSDYMSIHLDYDSDGIGTPVFIDRCVWNGVYDDTGEGAAQDGTATFTVGSVDLPVDANGNGEMLIYVIYEAGSGKSYNIRDLSVQGNSISGSILPSLSGEVEDCTDDFTDPVVPQFDDTDIEWLCNEPGNQEFWFNRVWTVTDDCGKTEVLITQQIAVGTLPYFTETARDTTLSSCNNTPEIVSPAYDDDCDDALDVTFVISDITNGIPYTNDTGNTISGITFNSSDEHDTEYEVEWIITDDAGISASTTQTIIILQEIGLEISPNSFDFCSGEEVSFDLTISGGTGFFADPSSSITPAGTWTAGNPENTSGTYTTSLLGFDAGEVSTITVTLEELDNGVVSEGACTPVFTFDHLTDFQIRENISTGDINRID